MRILVFLLALFFLSSEVIIGQENSLTQKLDYNKYYNLDFDVENNDVRAWTLGANIMPSHVGVSKNRSNSRLPLAIYQILYQGRRQKFQINLCNQEKLLLPFISEKDVEVSLSCKSENLLPLIFVTSGFNDAEEKILSDTMIISNDNIWRQSYSKKIPAANCRFLYFDLIAKGIDSTYTLELMPVSNSCDQNLWLEKLELKVDGKDINRYLLSDVIGEYDLKEISTIPLTDENLYFDGIDNLNNKRILSIGESVYGSETFSKFASQMIKYQVKQNNCKLVLIETPLEQTLSMNRFIQGDESFNIDSILYIMKYTYHSYGIMKELLLWLKSFNQTVEEKVWLFGFDTNNWIDNGIVNLDIAEFLCDINETLKNSAIYDACDDLLYAKKYFDEPLEKLKSNDKVKEVIGEKEFNIIIYRLELLKRTQNMMTTYYGERHKVMFDNVRLLIDLLCSEKENVVIYGHFDYMNYKYGQKMINSFGYYMKQYYNDQYSTLCLLSAQGDIFYKELNNFITTRTLKQPPVNSLEYAFLTKTSDDCIFVPAESFFERMTLIRNLDSNYYNETFSVFSPKNRTDAFIFIRNSKPSNHLPDVYNTGFDFNTFMLNKVSKIEGKYQSRFNGLPNILETYE